MQWIIPGTTLSAQREQAQQVDQVFHSLFLAGGLTLSQVASLTGLEPHTIQNWVKRGFLPPPQGKRYSMEQLCRILNMHILKGNMNLDQIVKLMQYLNGNLADTSSGIPVGLCCIDSFASSRGLRIGLIKLDIEGFELEAVRGAEMTIQRDRPILLISIYHTVKDFFGVKAVLEELVPDYRFSIRHLDANEMLLEYMLIGVPGELA